MSTIHTMFTGKTDSLIDAVRDNPHALNEVRVMEERLKRKWQENYENANRAYKEVITSANYDKLPTTHPDHPDYMRMVVHQMD